MRAKKDEAQSIVLPPGAIPGKIGVVTVTFGSGEVLPDFLASLAKQTYRNFVLIAVDNRSPDNTLAQLKTYPDCEVIVIENNDNLGAAAGNNQGICAAIEAGCEYVLLINNDVVFGEDLFQRLLDGIVLHNCHMTTPVMYYHDRPNIVWAAGGKFQSLFGYKCFVFGDQEVEKFDLRNDRPVQHTPTTCVLVRRDVFQKVGLIDERYFAYHEDTDWMLRAYRLKQSLYLLTGAKLLHKVSSLSGAGSDFQVRFSTRNRAFMVVKFLGRILSLPYTLAYRFLYVFRFLRGKDNYRMLKLKQSAWTEGARLPGNWLPL